MTEIKEILKQIGCSKDEIEICIQAITHINGDHAQLYSKLNELCKAQEELDSIKSKLAGVVGDLVKQDKPGKRAYHRKPKLEQPLIEKSGVAAAHEALREQLDELNEADKDKFKQASISPAKYKRQPRKRESLDEIKGHIDELTGGVKLTAEEAANNLQIDL